MSDPEKQPDETINEAPRGLESPGEHHDERPSDSPCNPRFDRGESTEPSDDRLANVLDQYLADVKAGKRVPHDQLMSDYPDLADELASCLPGIDFLHGVGSANEQSVPDDLGDFQILGTIGAGGMGVVYEAHQKSLDRIVALKVMRPGTLDEEAMQRFAREAETAAGLHHPNIVPIHAVGSHRGIHYYAMQRIQGKSLSEMSRDTSADNGGKSTLVPIATDTVSDWGLQAARALAHAHTRGVIHRDVKPSNLILDDERCVWLTDFGLAKRLGDGAMTMTGSILGTPRYMSPEQATRGDTQIDHRTDVYSLGATLYELASGQPVFDADTLIKLIDQIRSEEPQLPTRHLPSIHADFEAILMKCLAKQPRDRYATAGDLADDLQNFSDGKSVSARRITPVEQSRRWVVKNWDSVRWVGWTVAIIAALLLLSSIAFRSFSDLRIGKLSLNARTGPYVATILNPDGEPAAAPFALPTMTPAEIPEGDYRLRMETEGRPSEHVDVLVSGSKSLEYDFQPIRMPGWTLDGRDTMLIPFPLTNAKEAVYEIAAEHISRRDVSTGEIKWTANLKDVEADPIVLKNPDPNVPDIYTKPLKGIRWSWPRRQVAPWRGDVHSPFALTPGSDVDDDGIADLIVPGRGVPALLALSGRTGKVIWKRAYFFAGGQHVHLNSSNPDRFGPGVASMTPCADLDNDGIDDFVSVFTHKQFTGRPGCLVFVAAISSASGNVIWQHEGTTLTNVGTSPIPQTMGWSRRDVAELGMNHVQTTHTANSVYRGDPFAAFRRADEPMPYAPIVITDGQRSLLVVVDAKQLVILNAKEGTKISTFDLGAFPLSVIKTGDIVEGGFPELIIQTEASQVSQPFKLRPTLLSVWSIESGKLWEKSLQVDPTWMMISSPGPDWPIVHDFDRDGRDDILMSTNHRQLKQPSPNSAPEARVELFDGETGTSKWASPIKLYDADQQINRMINTTDLDGDNVDDLATVSMSIKPFESMSAFVDIFSGATGKHLRYKEIPLFGREFQEHSDWVHIRALRFQQLGGRSVCEVEFETRVQSLGTQYVHSVAFDAMTGDDIGLAKGVHPAKRYVNTSTKILIERDVPDLSSKMTRFHVTDNDASTRWRRMGHELAVADDLDGDGVDDVIGIRYLGSQATPGTPVQATELAAFSGATDRRIWSHSIPFRRNAMMFIVGDVDGDGRGDILVLPEETTSREQPKIWSARNGRLLKTLAADYHRLQQVANVEMVDVNGDGTNEIVLLAGMWTDTPRFGVPNTGSPRQGHYVLVCDLVDSKMSLRIRMMDEVWHRNVPDPCFVGKGDARCIVCVCRSKTSAGAMDLVGFDPKTGKEKWRTILRLSQDEMKRSGFRVLTIPDQPATSVAGSTIPAMVAFIANDDPSVQNSGFQLHVVNPSEGDIVSSFDFPASSRSGTGYARHCHVLRRKDGGTDLLVAWRDASDFVLHWRLIKRGADGRWKASAEKSFKRKDRRPTYGDVMISDLPLVNDKSDYKNGISVWSSARRLEAWFPDLDEPVWTQELPAFPSDMLQDSDGDIVGLFSDSSSAVCFSAETGNVKWKTALPFSRVNSRYADPPSFIHCGDEAVMTLLKYGDSDYIALDIQPVVTAATNLATTNSPTRLISLNSKPDPRMVHNLPMAHAYWSDDYGALPLDALRFLVVFLFGIVVPITYLVQTLRRRKFSIQWMMLAPVVSILALTGLNLAPAEPFLDIPRWAHPFLYILSRLPVAAYLGVLLWTFTRRSWWWLVGFVAMTLLVASGFGVLSMITAQLMNPTAGSYVLNFEACISIAAVSVYATGILLTVLLLSVLVVQSIIHIFSRFRAPTKTGLRHA